MIIIIIISWYTWNIFYIAILKVYYASFHDALIEYFGSAAAQRTAIFHVKFSWFGCLTNERHYED